MQNKVHQCNTAQLGSKFPLQDFPLQSMQHSEIHGHSFSRQLLCAENQATDSLSARPAPVLQCTIHLSSALTPPRSSLHPWRATAPSWFCPTSDGACGLMQIPHANSKAAFPLLWSSSAISQDNPWCQLSTGPSSNSQMSSAEHHLKPIWLLEHPNLGGVLKLLELRGEETLKSCWSSSSKTQTPNHSLCLQSLTGLISTTPATPLIQGTNHHRSCCLSLAGIPNKLAPVKHSSMGHFRVRKSNWGAMESPAEFTKGR